MAVTEAERKAARDMEERVTDAVGRFNLARLRGLWTEARMALAAADRALELLEADEKRRRPQ
ncbi:MAG TPA: hypothetical protein VMY69_03460 [Phycisphaerae bacterium]|nr:hypothetical protein [Phycisphaerae bacterium]